MKGVLLSVTLLNSAFQLGWNRVKSAKSGRGDLSIWQSGRVKSSLPRKYNHS
jgi:hypothetical protein